MRSHCRRFLIRVGVLAQIATVVVSGWAEDGRRSAIRVVASGVGAGHDSPLRAAPAHPWAASGTTTALAGDSGAGASSVAFVSAGGLAVPAAPNWVQQVQFTTIEPVAVQPASHPSPAAKADPDTSAEFVEQKSRNTIATTNAVQPRAAAEAARRPVPLPATRLAMTPSDIRRPAPAWSPPSEPAVTKQAQNVLNFYGGQSARATLSELPRRTPIQPAATARTPLNRPKGKPYQAVASDPTVSPYLNLHRAEDDSDGAPNYYSFVRPQMELQDAHRRQQIEIQRLQRQMQGSSTVAAPKYQNPSAAGTGTAARFMDTAQFYSAWQR